MSIVADLSVALNGAGDWRLSSRSQQRKVGATGNAPPESRRFAKTTVQRLGVVSRLAHDPRRRSRPFAAFHESERVSARRGPGD